MNTHTQNHTDEIRRTKEMMERQKVEERNALNDKLKAAANLRDENIKRILNRLREHVSHFVTFPKGVFLSHFCTFIVLVLMLKT